MGCECFVIDLIAGKLGECRVQVITDDFVFLFLMEQVICKQAISDVRAYSVLQYFCDHSVILLIKILFQF